jgi:hypothetical protein
MIVRKKENDYCSLSSTPPHGGAEVAEVKRMIYVPKNTKN